MGRGELVMPGLGCDLPTRRSCTTSLDSCPGGSKDRWAHGASVPPVWDTGRPEVRAFEIAAAVPSPRCPKARLRCSVRESGEAWRGPVWRWVPCTWCVL